MIRTVVWGTGNVGRAAIRAVDAHPGLELAAVLVSDPAKVGRDAGRLAGLGCDLGVVAVDDVGAVLDGRPVAVVYAATGDTRPDGALEDVARAVRAGAGRPSYRTRRRRSHGAPGGARPAGDRPVQPARQAEGVQEGAVVI